MSDAEKQGERFYVIAAGAQLVDLTKSFGTVEEATFAAQRGQMTQDTKFVVLGIRFCATIITAGAPAAIGSGRGRGKRTVRVFHDALPPGESPIPTSGYLNGTPVALHEGGPTIDEIQRAIDASDTRAVKTHMRQAAAILGEGKRVARMLPPAIEGELVDE